MRGRRFAVAFGVTAVLSSCSSTSAPSPTSPPASPSRSADPSTTSTPAATQSPPLPTSGIELGEPVPAVGWREVATFGGTNMLDEVAAVTFAAGQFVAVGRHYEFAPGSEGSAEGRIWLSSDGTSWEVVPSDPTFEHATLTSVVTAGDGTLLASGFIFTPSQALDSLAAYEMWHSTNGRTWRGAAEFETAVLPIGRVVHGRQGYLLSRAHGLSLATGPSGAELWHSLDGLSWDLVYESADERITTLAAGDEGFVAVREAADYATRITMASADGREWFDGDMLPEELAASSLAALDGDWVMVGRGSEGPPAEPGPVTPGVWELPVWFSANGLQWEPMTSISWPGDGLGFAGPGPLVSIGERLFLSPVAAGGGPRLSSAGVWSSADGSSWETTDIRTDVTIVDGAEHDGTVVLVGYVGPGLSATFWVNQRPE